MKLVARWFVDSFSVTQPPCSKVGSSKQQFVQHVVSPTGCLLLPLLHLLQFIPFDKNLIVASQIHKSIKRLKRALSTLIGGLDPNTLEKEVHPIAGGLSVGKVIAAIDTVMASWSRAAAVEARLINDTPLTFGPFEQLRVRIKSRFDELAVFQGDRDPPLWLPQSILGVWRTAPCTVNLSPLLTIPSREVKDSCGDEAQLLKAQLKEDEIATTVPILRKRGRAVAFLNAHKIVKMSKHEPRGRSLKQVSWADRPRNRHILTGPLKDERLFVRDEHILQEFLTTRRLKGSDRNLLDGIDMEDLF